MLLHPESLAATTNEMPVTLIVSRVPGGRRRLRELWNARELIAFFIWRDVKVRYRQTALGASWALLQPLMMMVVFSMVFGRVAGISSGSMPYPLLAYAGVLPWTFFATAVAASGNSVIHSERLITKIYFTRIAIPIASVGASVVDFAVASVFLAILMVYYRVVPGIGLLLAPLIFATIFVAALGVGTLLAALNVSYRDFRYLIPFMIQLWLFATPAVYLPNQEQPLMQNHLSAPSEVNTHSMVTGRTGGLRTPGTGRLREWVPAMFALNPLNHLIAAFRAALLGGAIPWVGLGASSAAAILMLTLGCVYFQCVEDGFADVI